MNLAILKLEGSDDALQTVCKTLCLTPNFIWKQGEKKRRGGFFASSGLSVKIADTNNPGEMLDAICQFTAKCTAQNVAFPNPDISAELSVGITVGDSEQFIACLDFSANDLLSLGVLGIQLSIAAYPTSEEANETD